MATWPAQLPAPQLNGYGATPDEPILRTQMEAGAARTRRQFGAIPDSITLSWVFTTPEMALFEAWHKLEALDGAAWFSISLPNGLGLQAVEAKFNAPPKKTLRGALNWQVSAEIKVRNAPTLTRRSMDVALACGPNEIASASSALHTLIHTRLPASGYW